MGTGPETWSGVMFERFTDHARRAIVFAQEEARELDHNYIGTEHLLLGLLRGQGTSAARVLESAGITLDAARAEVTEIIGRGQVTPSGHIPFTPRAKKVLELSLRESTALGHSHIGTGHLLLGLIHEGDGVAVVVLNRLGADLDDLRERTAEGTPADPERETVGGPSPQSAATAATVAAARLSMQPGAIVNRLARIDARLVAIEARLGLVLPVPDEPLEDAGSEEVVRLRSEVERLRAVLREHDIDPGEPGFPDIAG
jgi:ATP-dependent Clp protease ATP-binding subunit ClpC